MTEASTGTVITVRGSSESHHPPERATVSMTVAHDGPDKADVYRRAVEAANALSTTVKELIDPGNGPAIWWSADRLHTWFERPWDQHGRQLAPVFHARARLRVTFRDLDALGRFLDDVATRPMVAVDDVAWALTEEHRRELDRDARRRAVHDAAERARDYAEAAGFSSVDFLAVADLGMLGDEPTPRFHAERLGIKMSGSVEQMQLAPQDITVAASVEARFVARP